LIFSKYSPKYAGAICAVKDSEFAKIMKIYFDLAWENALEITDSNL
jgi:hypothetical protein